MRPKKSLGQHFLTCDWVIDPLIRAADIKKTDTVLEIGPGTGVLTRPLAERAGKIIAVEKDETLAENLRKEFRERKADHVTIVTGDIITLLRSGFVDLSRIKIVANIPYYLTSRLIRILLESKNRPSRIALTIQKEVALRIIEQAPHASLLSLSVQVFGVPKLIQTVPASCFSPKPTVDSAIISISDISDKFFHEINITPEKFFEILKLGFSQKRKQMAGVFGKKFGKTKTSEIFVRCGVPITARAQELSREQWARLASLL